MVRINKSAARVGDLKWRKSGNVVTLYWGTNRNTGEDIVWQVLNGDRRSTTRHTGENIPRLVAELVAAINAGELQWQAQTLIAPPFVSKFTCKP